MRADLVGVLWPHSTSGGRNSVIQLDMNAKLCYIIDAVGGLFWQLGRVVEWQTR